LNWFSIKLVAQHLSLNWMAASNVKSDAAIQPSCGSATDFTCVHQQDKSMINWLQLTYQSTKAPLCFEMSVVIIWSLIY
jgi:hypothetical protein